MDENTSYAHGREVNTTRYISILTILFLLSLLVGIPVAAAVTVEVVSSQKWITANGLDSAYISVSVTDGGKAVSGAAVVLSVSSPWVLRDTGGTTPAGGQIATVFLPTTKSGTAEITATVTVPGSPIPVIGNYSQKIDASHPMRAEKKYKITASVGSITDITVRVTDIYGNPVTSLMDPNLVTFNTTSSGDNTFVDPSSKKVKVKNLAIALNDTGYASVGFAVSTHPGDNFLYITPPSPLPPSLIKIRGIADLPPASITQTVTPGGKPPTLPTSTAKFIIEYELTDTYGNPSTNQYLNISTNAGESRTILSNNAGNVIISYGPKATAGRYTITATSQADPNISVVQLVQFLAGDPTNMLLTASPQSMASLDVDPGTVSSLIAKVVDASGNPRGGQTVSFSIQPPVKNGSYIQTSLPYLDRKTYTIGDEVTAITDENGLATVDFYPGAFFSNTSDPRFSTMAVATATVRAKWSSVTRTMDLSYKNFPYLSVYTSVDPSTVETNRTVDVTIRVKGDGYALQPKPVDVYMVLDRSGSMLTDYQDRMVVLMKAAETFATKFNYTTDQLGQFSFGEKGSVDATWDNNCGKDGDSSDDAAYASKNYPGSPRSYSDYAFMDIGLSRSPANIASAIKATVPGGYTPMRYALKQSIAALINDKNKGVVKALVLFSDGDYNYFGDPLARGSVGSTDPTSYDDLNPDYVSFSGVSSQNMAVYAKANNIKIFTIGYGAQLSSGGRDTLQKIATTTGGKYYYASTGDDLASVFTDIAGALKDTAGVATYVALDFSKVEVTDVKGVQVGTGSSVFKYERIPWKSTLVTLPDKSQRDVNNSADW
ncbi:MAG: VWA domain-containing protein, partial [Methanomicrobiales archaeon]